MTPVDRRIAELRQMHEDLRAERANTPGWHWIRRRKLARDMDVFEQAVRTAEKRFLIGDYRLADYPHYPGREAG